MKFEFASAGRILFEIGAARQLSQFSGHFGRKALFVAGNTLDRSAPILRSLTDSGCAPVIFRISTEPSTTVVDEGAALARDVDCKWIIGFGGGSVMDAAKAIAAMSTNPGSVHDYLEVVGAGKLLVRPPLPWVALPTTAGTGAEVTRNSVLSSPQHGIKASLRHPSLLARVALVDPELTFRLPSPLTASTGFDALTQLIEAYVSCRANPITDALCLDGLSRAAAALKLSWEHACLSETGGASDSPSHLLARQDMMLAALFSGLALANAGLGLVHGLAGPVGGACHGPHGAICAALLPHAVRTNIRAMQHREPSHPALERYLRITRILTGQPVATLDESWIWLQTLSKELGIQGLRHFGVSSIDAPKLVAAARNSSSLKSNPILLTDFEMQETIEAAI